MQKRLISRSETDEISFLSLIKFCASIMLFIDKRFNSSQKSKSSLDIYLYIHFLS